MAKDRQMMSKQKFTYVSKLGLEKLMPFFKRIHNFMYVDSDQKMCETNMSVLKTRHS